ncbi:CheY-like chemotaxis protein [Flavobacterium sp. CG_23.5]|uniref:response regulator n=1 Tax=unclassified Flavobacterium TaxID=196869 RepID=UPI0018CA4362|nr:MULTISPECIES: response regulator [unclassified Flavobacterium]MBG6111142.1 CheY-like chemotaxis protein [Flavobacterium sp. CG_9.10]MBP2282591.1 CheY-like chemotaxis protein [Flavobacterium sp. CG_23.5]
MKNKLTYIIDDDKLSLKLLTILIAKNEFCDDIRSFFNPQAALDELKKNCNENKNLPDAILLDLNMPVMDGWQFLDEFNHLTLKKEIPIFIITSSIDPADIEMAKNYTVVKNYINKPITAEKLTALCKLI